jgi:UDPglucose 6-dehydrogenase
MAFVEASSGTGRTTTERTPDVRVSIIGTGYVGLVSGACLADRGHHVVCVDLDPAKVALIQNATAPIHEAGLPELLARTCGTNLFATTDLRTAVLESDLTLIAVGTPYSGERIDLTQIRSAASAIGSALRDKTGYHVVVVKSTVVPGTTRTVVVPLLEEASGKTAGVDFGVGMNPEFLSEGIAVADFMFPDRIVVGGVDPRSQDAIAALYESFPDVDVLRTTTDTAEMTKYAANALLATLISFSNEIGNLCEVLGTDVVDVMRGVHLDKRFSPLLDDGTRVRPGMISYLAAGCGYGGSCFPKDVRALIAHGRGVGEPMALLGAVTSINERQPSRVTDLVRRGLERTGQTLAGARVTVLGIAFKPETDDVRESPALVVIDELLSAGAAVTAHDPIARVDDQRIVWANSVPEAVRDADAVVLMTTWSEYAGLDAYFAGSTEPLVVDARRFLDPRSYTSYVGIGFGTPAATISHSV